MPDIFDSLASDTAPTGDIFDSLAPEPVQQEPKPVVAEPAAPPAPDAQPAPTAELATQADYRPPGEGDRAALKDVPDQPEPDSSDVSGFIVSQEFDAAKQAAESKRTIAENYARDFSPESIGNNDPVYRADYEARLNRLNADAASANAEVTRLGTFNPQTISHLAPEEQLAKEAPGSFLYQKAAASLIPEEWQKKILELESPEFVGGAIVESDPTQSQRLIRHMIGEDRYNQMTAGVLRGVTKMAMGFISPMGIALPGVSKLPTMAQKAISLGFAADMAIHAPEAFAAIGNAKTPAETAQATTEAVLTAAMAVAAFKHGAGREAHGGPKPELRQKGEPLFDYETMSALAESIGKNAEAEKQHELEQAQAELLKADGFPDYAKAKSEEAAAALQAEKDLADQKLRDSIAEIQRLRGERDKSLTEPTTEGGDSAKVQDSARAGWWQLAPDDREVLAIRLDRILEKKGAVEWGDIPVDLQNQIGTSESNNLKAAFAANPRAAIDALTPKGGDTSGKIQTEAEVQKEGRGQDVLTGKAPSVPEVPTEPSDLVLNNFSDENGKPYVVGKAPTSDLNDILTLEPTPEERTAIEGELARRNAITPAVEPVPSGTEPSSKAVEGKAPADEATAPTEAPKPQKPKIVSTGLPGGAKVEVIDDYIEAADLKPMLERRVNAAQTRERSGNKASDEQIAKIKTEPDPTLLGDSPTSTVGAPVVDDTILAGNGRSEGLIQGYEADTAGSKSYREHVIEHAKGNGRDISGMKQPIHIRRIQRYVNGDRRSFVVESNPKYAALQETTAESALLDADALGDASQYEFREDGTLTSESVQTVGQNLAKAQRGLNRTTGGKFDEAEATRRVQLAALAKLARDNNVDVSELTGFVETDVGRRVLGEITRSTPRLAKLDTDLGIGGPILTALRTFNQGVRTVREGKVDDLVKWNENRHNELIQDALTPEADILVDVMVAAQKKPSILRELLDEYASQAEHEQSNRTAATQSDDIFGEQRSNVSGEKILARTLPKKPDAAPTATPASGAKSTEPVAPEVSPSFQPPVEPKTDDLLVRRSKGAEEQARQDALEAAYEKQFEEWVKSVPENKAIVMKLAEKSAKGEAWNRYAAITKDPKGGWRVTRFDETLEMPMGHSEFKTRLEAAKELKGWERIEKLPFTVKAGEFHSQRTPHLWLKEPGKEPRMVKFGGYEKGGETAQVMDLNKVFKDGDWESVKADDLSRPTPEEGVRAKAQEDAQWKQLEKDRAEKKKDETPVPYSKKAIQKAFNLNPDQAEATDAIVKATGLDESKIEVARGTQPEISALAQIEGKIIKGRAPEIQQGVRDFLDGKITREAYNAIVQKHKPVTPLEEVPKPVTIDEMLDAKEGVKSNSRPVVGKGSSIVPGTTVSLRTDLPWKAKTGKAAVVIHANDAGKKPGTVLAFEGVGRIKSPRFLGSEKEAARIALGESRTPFAAVQGEWSADQSIPADVKTWTQVGFDPTRHSFYYDKATMLPVEGGTEAVQIGNTVFVKDARFGDPSKPLYQSGKGSAEFAADGKALIRGFKDADVSTGVHEIAHVVRRQLLDRNVSPENRKGITDSEIDAAEKWAGAEEGEWTRAAEERFARGFEKYLADGEAPTPTLKSVFAKFGKWLTDIYKKITGSDIDVEITPEMKEVFDKLVTRMEEKPKAEAPRPVVQRAEPPPPKFEDGAKVRVKGEGDFERDGIVTGIGPARAGEEPTFFVRTPVGEQVYRESQIKAAMETQVIAPETTGPVAVESGPKSNVVFGNEAHNAPMQLAVSEANHHYTLWVREKNPPGSLRSHSPWRYVKILGRTREEANLRAAESAHKIASGDLTGMAFLGKEKFKQPDAIGVLEDHIGREELMGIEKTKLGEQALGFGSKYPDVLVKDLFSKDPGYATWVAEKASGSQRIRDVAEYIRNLPEYRVAKEADVLAAREAITPESETLLKRFNLTATAREDGSIIVGGKTYDWKDTIKQFGGRFDSADTGWSIRPQGFADLVTKLGGIELPDGGQRSGFPTYVSDPRLTELRATIERRPDGSGFTRPVESYIGSDTAELIRRGEKYGMPKTVLDEQVEDVARMNRAFQDGKRLFLLASAPGTGKTFVLGAAIRELRKSGAKSITYVTLREELISQIKNDLKDYDIGDVNFVTYYEIRTGKPVPSDVLIFDEAHAIKNTGGEDAAATAQAAQQWVKQSKFPIFSTATPFENPVEAAYLEPTGIFEPFGSFKDFALTFGATEIKLKDSDSSLITWKTTVTSNKDQIAAKAYFQKEGIFTARKTQLPPKQVDARMVKVQADKGVADIYHGFTEAAEMARGEMVPNARAWVKNFQKRLLEAAKVQGAIAEAQSALDRGRWPIIFVETKAERKIDIPNLIEREEEWKRAVAMTQKGDPRPQRKDYGLPPRGITEAMAIFMEKTGVKVIEIPSAEDLVKDHFGEENVAIFTGSVSPKRAQENLDRWRGKKPMVLVATMAKGGTGLSLHDKVGNHQTTQINLNLPWKATQVEQVSLRSARYGLVGKAEMMWMFADNIPFDRELGARVGKRMGDMGAIVHGEAPKSAGDIENWDFDDPAFSDMLKKQVEEQKKTPQAPAAAPTTPPAPTEAPKPASFPVELAKRMLGREPVPSGPANVEMRRDILEAITGTRPAKVKAGVNVVEAALAEHLGVDPNQTKAGITAAVREKLKSIVEEEKTAASAAIPREQKIADILHAARRREPKAVERFELKGDDGKWYLPEGFPYGVKSTGERRSIGFTIQHKDGTFGGQGYRKSAQEIIDTHNRNQDEQAAEFRSELEKATDDELTQKHVFWMDELAQDERLNGPKPRVEPVPELAPSVPDLPKLRRGENQGDIFSKQTEDLKLVGEESRDTVAEAERAAAEEKARAEAQAEQDALQGRFFSFTPRIGEAEPIPSSSRHLGDVVRVVEALKRTVNGVRVRVLRNERDLPMDVQDQIDRYSIHEGLTDTKSGDVWIFADNIDSGSRAAEVFAHEVVGHYGVEKILPESEWSGIADSIIRSQRDEATKIARDYLNGRELDTLNPDQRNLIAREFVARLAEKPSIAPGLWERIVVGVKRALRKMGIRKNWSEDEIRDLLRQSARKVSERPEGSTGVGELFGKKRPTQVRLTIDELSRAADVAADWRDWYDRHQKLVADLFHEDAPIFMDFLAATSQNTGVMANVTNALKAYRLWLDGKPFDGRERGEKRPGFLPPIIDNLNRAVRREALQGPKIGEFSKANAGDQNAITVDLHISELLFGEQKPTDKMIALAKEAINELAKEKGWTPRDLQAALWAANFIRRGETPASYDTYLNSRRTEIADIRRGAGRTQGSVRGRSRSEAGAGRTDVAGGQSERDADLGTARTEAGTPERALRAAVRRATPEEIAARLGDEVPPTVQPPTFAKMPPETTGLKRAVVDAERLSRGLPEIPTAARQHEQDVLDRVMAQTAKDPTIAKNLVARIVDRGITAISESDAATLLVERRSLVNERAMWESSLAKGGDSKVARDNIRSVEDQLDRLDHAQRAAGTTWGRMGHMYQRLMLEDYTFDAMRRRMEDAKGERLTDSEREHLQALETRVKELQEQSEAAQKAIEEHEQLQESIRTYEATIKELRDDLESAKKVKAERLPPIPKAVLEAVQADLGSAASKARERLAARRGGSLRAAARRATPEEIAARTGKAALDPQDLADYSIIGAEYIAKGMRGEANAAKWRKAMLDEFGDGISEHLDEIRAAAEAEFERDRKTVAEKQSRESLLKEAASSAEKGEELSHRLVYDLAKEHINNGVHGEDAVMAAVHEDLKPMFPELKERDVRRAFSEYGKVKFPSRDADKAELRELRTLVRLQESIDRLREGQDALHSGLQRDKATREITEKQTMLNNLLKLREETNPSPEKLATTNAIRVRSLQKQIEAIDHQLRTGEKPTRNRPPMPSDEVERLRAERDSMRALVEEIEAKENPPMSAEQKALDAALVQRARWEQILEGTLTEQKKPAREALTQMEEDVRMETDAMKRVAAEMRRNALPKTDPNAARQKAAIAALEKSAAEYLRRAKEADFESTGPMQGPPTEAIAKAKAARDAAKAAFDAAKEAANPKPTPDEKWNTRREKQVNKYIAKLNERIAKNDYFKPAEKPKPAKNQAVIDAEVALDATKQKFLKGLREAEKARRTKARVVLDGIQMTRGAFTNIASSMDFSAPRQGLLAILANSTRLLTNPVAGARLLGIPFREMFRAWASEKGAREIQKAIELRPNAKNGLDKAAGIEFSSLETNKFTRYEENAHSILDEWAELDFRTGNALKSVTSAPFKVAARSIRMSNRAFIVFLNSTRAELFDQLLKENFSDHAPSPAELKTVGNLVNVTTGRGKLNPKFASAASEVFWAPKLLASRVQFITGQPFFQGEGRMIVAKEYARIIAGGFLLNMVGRMFSDKHEDDPRSSDFGKLIINGTRIDPWGGLQQVTVLASREISGKTKTMSGEVKAIRGAKRPYGTDDGFMVAAKFARTKLRPDIGTLVDLASGSNVIGESVNAGTVVESLLVPLPFRDVKEIMKQHGFAEGMAIEAAGQFGAGVSHYGAREHQR